MQAGTVRVALVDHGVGDLVLGPDKGVAGRQVFDVDNLVGANADDARPFGQMPGCGRFGFPPDRPPFPWRLWAGRYMSSRARRGPGSSPSARATRSRSRLAWASAFEIRSTLRRVSSGKWTPRQPSLRGLAPADGPPPAHRSPDKRPASGGAAQNVAIDSTAALRLAPSSRFLSRSDSLTAPEQVFCGGP